MKSSRKNWRDKVWLVWVMLGLASVLFLVARRAASLTGASAPELAENAFAATMFEVHWSTHAVGDPETTNQQIDARWRQIAESSDSPDAPAVLKVARHACAPRTWPVEMKAGWLNGNRVWVVVSGWHATVDVTGCIDYCHAQYVDAQQRAEGANTEIAIVSAESPPRLIFHRDRDRTRIRNDGAGWNGAAE